MEISTDVSKRPSSGMRRDTPIKAIRAQCLDCCCGSRYEVEMCPATSCPLWPYRFGVRPETAAKRNKHVKAGQ